MLEKTTDKQILLSMFLHKEQQANNALYEQETDFFNAIKHGNLDFLHRAYIPLSNHVMGFYSDHPVRNLKYRFTIRITYITYFCIEYGMEFQDAFNLLYSAVQSLDACTAIPEIETLYKNTVFHYAKKMNILHENSIYTQNNHSFLVTQCLKFIFEHINEPITLGDLAASTGKNKTYLCNIFKKEMGVTIADFIRGEKIEVAKKLLSSSEDSYVDIGNSLAFNSQSHFIHVFKTYTGMTPKEYRQKNYANPRIP